jgi:adenylate cyclase
MRWWARRRLRAKIYLPFSLLVLATLLATLWLVNTAVSRQVEGNLRQQLEVTAQVFARMVRERAQRLLADTSLLAADFALKRAIATYDPDTLATVAVNYRARLGLDAVWITDEEGKLLARAPSDSGAGAAISLAPLAQALQLEDAASAISIIDGQLMEVVALPVLAPDPIGFLLAAEAIDDDTARQLRTETGSEVSFLTAHQIFASSWPAADRARLFPAARPRATTVQQAPGAAFLLSLGSERLLSILVPIDARLGEPLFALVQQSYDRALEPLEALRRRVALIGLGALGAALVVGGALANGIAAPLQALVAAMGRVLAGDLRQRLQVRREDEIGYLAQSFNDMVAGLEERERIKDTFGRFVSRDVASAVLSGQLPLQGERREVTILFQDIRGFTTISEQSEPDTLVRMLNLFFTEIVAAVESEGGIIRQFTGDGVMALFGAPVMHPDDPLRAVRAALAMVARLPALNDRLDAQGLPRLRIGVGIHTGEVVAGRIGPDQRIEYSVVGDAVNTASRIEGLTKELHATILISAATASRLPSGIRLGRRAVLPIRGKEQPVEVVEVEGLT